jgi:hypothetical protein
VTTSADIARTFRRTAREQAARFSELRGRANKDAAVAYEYLTCEVFSPSEVVARSPSGRDTLPRAVLDLVLLSLNLEATYVSQGDGAILADWRPLKP